MSTLEQISLVFIDHCEEQTSFTKNYYQSTASTPKQSKPIGARLQNDPVSEKCLTLQNATSIPVIPISKVVSSHEELWFQTRRGEVVTVTGVATLRQRGT